MRNKTLKNVIVILGCSIAGKVLSYVWEAVLAAYLGATDQADAFYMTTSVFNILYPILDIGIWKVFLPIYRKTMVREPGEEDKFANKASSVFLCISFVLVLFLLIFARPLIYVMAPGFSPEKKAITANYIRITAPAYFLMATASTIGAMLQCHERFFGSQIRQIGTHVAKILYVIICYRYMGIYAALTAMIIGSIVRLLIQLPFINWKWRFKPDFRLKDQNVKTMLKGLPSVALTVAIQHINGLIDKMVASGAKRGAISCLNYGYKLVNVFSGMISSAVVMAVYPQMISHIAKKEDKQLRTIVNNVINALVFLIVPISAFCVLFSNGIVKAAFERGNFDSTATALTASVFIGYSIGMIVSAVSSVITSIFYGYGDTKITLWISMLNIALNIGFDLLFYQFFGVTGLAVATSVSAAICLVVRLIYLKKYIRLGYRELFIEMAKILLLSAIAVGAAYVVFGVLLHLNVYLTLILSVFMIAAIYIPLAKLFRIKTLGFIIGIVKGFFKRGKKNTTESA